MERDDMERKSVERSVLNISEISIKYSYRDV